MRERTAKLFAALFMVCATYLLRWLARALKPVAYSPTRDFCGVPPRPVRVARPQTSAPTTINGMRVSSLVFDEYDTLNDPVARQSAQAREALREQERQDLA